MRAKPRDDRRRGEVPVGDALAEATPHRQDSRGFARMARSYGGVCILG